MSDAAPQRRWKKHRSREIAALTLFLASAYARPITSQFVNIDGGFE